MPRRVGGQVESETLKIIELEEVPDRPVVSDRRCECRRGSYL